MLTRKVLSTISDPELRASLKLNSNTTETSLDKVSRISWIIDDIDNFSPESPTTSRLQQTNLLRNFYMSIAEHDLQYAYKRAKSRNRLSTPTLGDQKQVCFIWAIPKIRVLALQPYYPKSQ